MQNLNQHHDGHPQPETRMALPFDLTAPELETYVQKLPIYDGYPYIITWIVPAIYHVIPLPVALPVTDLIGLTAGQAEANKLHSCLVFSETDCLYFRTDGTREWSETPPRGGTLVAALLRGRFKFERGDDVHLRIEAIIDSMAEKDENAYILGDPNKGGRPAKKWELQELTGFTKGLVPKGLVKCNFCGNYRGRCLDPGEKWLGMVMDVHCLCQNDNRCAVCGELLASRKLNSNYYDPEDGRIWHYPGFRGFDHECV